MGDNAYVLAKELAEEVARLEKLGKDLFDERYSTKDGARHKQVLIEQDQQRQDLAVAADKLRMHTRAVYGIDPRELARLLCC